MLAYFARGEKVYKLTRDNEAYIPFKAGALVSESGKILCGEPISRGFGSFLFSTGWSTKTLKQEITKKDLYK